MTNFTNQPIKLSEDFKNALSQIVSDRGIPFRTPIYGFGSQTESDVTETVMLTVAETVKHYGASKIMFSDDLVIFRTTQNEYNMISDYLSNCEYVESVTLMGYHVNALDKSLQKIDDIDLFTRTQIDVSHNVILDWYVTIDSKFVHYANVYAMDGNNGTFDSVLEMVESETPREITNGDLTIQSSDMNEFALQFETKSKNGRVTLRSYDMEFLELVLTFDIVGSTITDDMKEVIVDDLNDAYAQVSTQLFELGYIYDDNLENTDATATFQYTVESGFVTVDFIRFVATDGIATASEVQQLFPDATIYVSQSPYETDYDDTLHEAFRVIKVNSRGQKTVKMKCQPGQRYDVTKHTCVVMSGAERNVKRIAMKQAVRTKKAAGSAAKKRQARLTRKALLKRRQFGLD